jgi:hypothetical protein
MQLDRITDWYIDNEDINPNAIVLIIVLIFLFHALL